MSERRPKPLHNQARRRVLGRLSAVAAAGCLAGAVMAMPAGAARPQEARPLASSTAVSCTLPVVHDSYRGFRVGVPAGWDVSTLDGTVSVQKGSSGAEAALVYPAALASGLTPAKFFAAYMRYQQRFVAKGGDSLTFQMQPGASGLPRASIRLRSKTLDLVGEAS